MSDKITVLIMHTPPTSTTPPVQTDGTRHLSRWRESWPDRCNPPIFPFLPPGCSPSYQVFNLSSPGGGMTPECKKPQRNVWGILLINASSLPPRRDCLFFWPSLLKFWPWCAGSGWCVAYYCFIFVLLLFFFLLMAYPRNQTVLHMGPKSDYYFLKFLFNFENTGTELISMEED